jgi:hypothetical protein
MYIGDEAINYLISQVNNDDPASSSHWKKYHQKFDVRPEGVVGIEGFGSNDLAYRGIRRVIHWFLQIYFKFWVLNSFKRIILYYKFNTLNEKILKITNQGYSTDFLRQTLTLTLLNEKIPEMFNSNETILIIGDGFANLTNLINETKSVKNIVLINLTKTLLVDSLYLKKCIGEENFNKKVKLITESDSDLDVEFNSSENKYIYLIEAKNHRFLASIPFQLVINIASMQEMEKSVIKEYFEYIQAKEDTYFYCCNREEKILPDGTIIRFNEYPWKINDKIILNELCPWHQKYYEFPWPIYKNYDGPHIHQLRKMNSK